MKTLAVINQKGGVAKTTTAAAIGAGLSSRGHRVLFIDLDAQGNLSSSLGAGGRAPGALELLTGQSVEPQHTAQGDLIGSTPALAAADTTITETGKEYRLKEALEPLSPSYDFAIVDTPPALGILTVNALTAATAAIVPAQADIFSLEGIGQLSGTIDAVRRYCNPSLKIAGIVLTRYNWRTILGREVKELIERTAGQLHTKLYKTKIRECTALKEAQARRQSIFDYAPRSNAAKDYAALVDEILEKGV